MARRQYKYTGDTPIHMPDLAGDPERQGKDDPALVKPGDVVTIESDLVSQREDFKAASAPKKAAPSPTKPAEGEGSDQ